MQTREQTYAQGVYALVSRVAVRSDAEKNKYGAIAHKLPILIRTAGLAQALAFTTRDAVQQKLLHDLATVMGFEQSEALLKASREASIGEYMYLTQEALAALLWFKRFAEFVLEVQPGTDAEVSV
ncbi:MAG: type III-B CRISPR module-associated protein Cmr5 [Kouleothrix sp.]|jgi:CRISPR-associated protein Cmr5|nr:type III-B CRISPR module-associated protein Cmr5 [Kouleothrix sp.]